jgi:hypothetical protein
MMKPTPVTWHSRLARRFAVPCAISKPHQRWVLRTWRQEVPLSHWTSAERKQFFDKKFERKDGRSEYRKRDRNDDDSEDSHSHPKTKRKMSKHYDSLIKNCRKKTANQASHIRALTSKLRRGRRQSATAKKAHPVPLVPRPQSQTTGGHASSRPGLPPQWRRAWTPRVFLRHSN